MNNAKKGETKNRANQSYEKVRVKCPDSDIRYK